MLEVIRQNIAAVPTHEEKFNKAREFLQVLSLKILFDKGCFEDMAFVGGTALRLLHGMRRYSEDLDFSATRKTGFDFERMMRELGTELSKVGLSPEVGPVSTNVVRACKVKFPRILSELGLSPMASQKLMIKFEVDSNPPEGWGDEIRPFMGAYAFAVRTYDLPSLFASKLHALLFRKYAKGRDYYDLVWYLGKRVEPNIRLLNNAARQSGYDGEAFTKGNYRALLARKVERADFKRLRADVEAFLEDKSELKLFDRKLFLGMMK